MPMAHLHSVSMGIWVDAGARDENNEEMGLSHFIEHMIFKGTHRRSAYQIAKEFDAIGGATNALNSLENTCYYAKVMRSHLPTMVDILGDIFLHSVFDQNELERERPVIFQEISMLEDSPDEWVHHLAGSSFWGEHPLGRPIIGTREKLMRFDSGHLKNFFNKLYQPDRIVISAAGNIEHDDFLGLIQPVFNELTPAHQLPDREKPTDHFLTQIHNRDQEQVHLCIGMRGLPISDPDRYTLSLLNTILGGNMSSRLFQEIREQQGLAYSIYSFVSAYVDSGMLGVYAAVAPEKAVETVDRTLAVIRKLGELSIDSEELKSAKDYTKGSLLLAAESNDNQMIRLAQQEIHFGRHLQLKDILLKIDAVSAESILDLASRLYGDNRVALTTLGPLEDESLFDHLLKH